MNYNAIDSISPDKIGGDLTCLHLFKRLISFAVTLHECRRQGHEPAIRSSCFQRILLLLMFAIMSDTRCDRRP